MDVLTALTAITAKGNNSKQGCQRRRVQGKFQYQLSIFVNREILFQVYHVVRINSILTIKIFTVTS